MVVKLARVRVRVRVVRRMVSEVFAREQIGIEEQDCGEDRRMWNLISYVDLPNI